MSDSRKGAENVTNPQESLCMFIPDMQYKRAVECTNADIAIFHDSFPLVSDNPNRIAYSNRLLLALGITMNKVLKNIHSFPQEILMIKESQDLIGQDNLDFYVQNKRNTRFLNYFILNFLYLSNH